MSARGRIHRTERASIATIANERLTRKRGDKTGRQASAPASRHLRQEHGEQPDRRKKRTDLVDEADRSVIGELAQHGRAEAADAERDAEEHAGDHPEAV